MAGRSFKPTLCLEPVPSDDRNLLLRPPFPIIMCVCMCTRVLVYKQQRKMDCGLEGVGRTQIVFT